MTIRNFVKDSLHKFYQKLNDYFEVLTNKVTSLSSSSTDDQYPSAKAVYDALTTKANLNSPALTGTPTAPTAAAGTNTTQIATTAFVQNAFTTADAMIYKGTIAGGSTGAYGALTAAASRGWTYKVTTAGKIDGIAVEVGDMIICNTDSTAAATSSNYSTIAANWDFIQANIDGAVTGPTSAVSGRIATFNGTSGKVIQDSGYTIATSVPSGAVFTDTKNTAGSTDTSSKIFLIGATTQAANPQTYSDNEVYTTSGVLTTKSVQVGGTSATMQYNSTLQAIEFVFA